MTSDTPVGIRVVAGMTLLRGFYGFFTASTLLAAGGMVGGGAGAFAVGLAAVVVGLGFAQLFAAAGLWVGRWMGWLVATAVFGLNVGLGAFQAAVFGPTAGLLFSTLVDGAALTYLVAVRGHCTSNTTAEGSVEGNPLR